MKKILIAFDGAHFSEAAFSFARLVNELEPVLLTGIFLRAASYGGVYGYGTEALTGALYLPVVEGGDPSETEANIERFEKLCIQHHIEFRVHRDTDESALKQLKKESIFADLLIIGSQSFYRELQNGGLNEYLEKTLHDISCPVILVPDQFQFPSVNIITYDGSPSSVHAVKQFASLFPAFAKNKTFLIYAHADFIKNIPDLPYIEEYVSRHFPDLTISKLNFDPEELLEFWAAEKGNSIVIAGSFSRSAVSQLFRKSFLTEILEAQRLPIFIAHQ